MVSDEEKQLALLTGDLIEQGMAWVQREHKGLRPIVVELPHHGSFTAAAKEFVGGLQPRIVVQSTSQRREGDVRWNDVRAGAERWYTTSADGACFVEFGRDGSRARGFVPAIQL